MVNNKLYFILSSSCRLVQGLKRSLIIDYERGNLYFISHEYFLLLTSMDRHLFSDTEKEIDDDSRVFFDEFMQFVISSEIGYFSTTPEYFPRISDGLIDEYVQLTDVIIEVDETYFVESNFKRLCSDLNDLRCKDFEIRLLSKFNLAFLDKVINLIYTTDANCIEIHCTNEEDIDYSLLSKFIEEKSLISKIFIYAAPENKTIDIVNNTANINVPLGQVYFLEYPFAEGNCCGIIQPENLNYTSFYLHNHLKRRNGCLDKKISIDRYGNIKNCPSMKTKFGNIGDVSIKAILKREEFTKYWFINKDQITTCKVCEFRYNCTDCRAFLEDPEDIYSKPLKCGYNPESCTWEDWSTNPLKEKKNLAIHT
jgi:SPASM domain peptide maturase of grasp-with-spasm system